MKRYAVKVLTFVTVEANTPEEADQKALSVVQKHPYDYIWACNIMSCWGDDETLEDINRDISKELN